ncbi:response regulator transcription factor [Pantoea dispersa]|uniref:response regulator transcription factor n=1 Tax=Pantoea dispersa TaxID=59814 RepID=UPI002DB7BD20|nr:response regulator transcription factor [Pantoea dispersa]MEB5974930.1 response regulator transcription factor [Pantoea dispersa]
MLNVLIADDHAVIRVGIRMLLEKAGHKIIGETGNGMDAIGMSLKMRPDLVLLDISLSGLSGTEVIKQLRSLYDPPKILVFTSKTSKETIIRCQAMGINGFVAKTVGLLEFIEAVKIVERGYNYFPPSELMQKWQLEESEKVETNRLMSQLSIREFSVLKGLVSGLSNKELSLQMSLSEKTISTYKQRLKAKLNARSIVDLIGFARRSQLIE